jgi:glutamate/tyrosine decarboxylase-like PLP-dependent enzyme
MPIEHLDTRFNLVGGTIVGSWGTYDQFSPDDLRGLEQAASTENLETLPLEIVQHAAAAIAFMDENLARSSVV